MVLFGHHSQAQQPLEKPAPAHAHGDAPPRSSDATHVGSHPHHQQHQLTTDGMNGGGIAPIGDVSKDGRAWIYGRPTVGQWFKQHWVDICAFSRSLSALHALKLTLGTRSDYGGPRCRRARRVRGGSGSDSLVRHHLCRASLSLAR